MRAWVTAFVLLALGSPAAADTVAQATGIQGHKIRLTNEHCTVASGRSSQAGWGRTYSWLDSGLTITGCGRLDDDTVVIEWMLPGPVIDIRRYSVDNFLWNPPLDPMTK